MKAAVPLSIVFVLALSMPSARGGQTIYKSVDAQGHVTYSSTAPPTANGTESVTIRSDAERDARLKVQRQREDAERQTADDQKRREEEKALRGVAVAEAEQRLKAARQSLEAALQRGDDERRTLERGGVADSQAYRDRVAREERKVREAERALRAAKAGRLPPQNKSEPDTASP